MVTYGLSFIMGLFKTRLLISYFFNTSASLLDVYYAAFVIPDTVFQLLVIGALSAAFIPTFSRYLSKNESEAWDLAANTVNLILIIFGLISIAIFIFARPLSHLIAPGFSVSQISLMIRLLRVMLVAQIFFSISGFLTGIIQTHQRFLIPALAPVVYNLGIILGTIFLSPVIGIMGPAVGVVIGAVFHMLIQLPLAYKLGFRFQLRMDIKHSGVLEVLRLMPPRAIALGIDQIEQFVGVTLASVLASGTLSLLNASRLLYTIPSTLFGVTIGQAAFPALSKLSTRHDLSEFKQTFTSTLMQIAFVALPASTLFIVLRIPIVRLIFGSRAFPWEATLLMAKTVAILATSAGFYAVMQLVIRAFYALHDTKTPLFVGLGAALFNVFFSIFSVYFFHLELLGIGLAITLTTIFETLTLILILQHKLEGSIRFKTTLWPLLKMILINFLMGISLWIPMRFLDKFVFDTTHTLPLAGLTIITALVGFLVYIFLSYLFHIPELASFIDLFRRLTNWRRIFTPNTSEPLIVPAPDQN